MSYIAAAIVGAMMGAAAVFLWFLYMFKDAFRRPSLPRPARTS